MENVPSIEDKIVNLSKKILDKKFSNIQQKTIITTKQFLLNDDIIMIYNQNKKVLYYSDDLVYYLYFLGLNDDKIKKIVTDWFENKFDIPIFKSHQVSEEMLNKKHH